MRLQRLSPAELEQKIHGGHPPPIPPDPRDSALHVLREPPGSQSITEMMKGPDHMTANIAAPANIDATRAGAVAIEGAYRIRETQARLLELAKLVGPVTQAASLLKLEIKGIEAEMATIEGQHMAAVTAATGDDGKKTYTNKESREAAVSKALAVDANAKVLTASLAEKREALAKAEADERAIVTEIGALKAVMIGGAAALNALGLAAV